MTIIERNATKYVRLQRKDQQQMNTAAHATLARRGLVFNDVDAAPFRTQLAGVYSTWKEGSGAGAGSCSKKAQSVKA